MSWGKGIALVLALFVIMIGTLVYMSTQQHFNLVTEKYYEESLDYDKVQNKRSNYTKLEEVVQVDIDHEKGLMSVTLPSGFEEETTGKIHLYCPTDSKLDRIFELEQPLTFSTEKLKKGKWSVIVDWEKAGKSYLFERSVFIN